MAGSFRIRTHNQNGRRISECTSWNFTTATGPIGEPTSIPRGSCVAHLHWEGIKGIQTGYSICVDMSALGDGDHPPGLGAGDDAGVAIRIPNVNFPVKTNASDVVRVSDDPDTGAFRYRRLNGCGNGAVFLITDNAANINYPHATIQNEIADTDILGNNLQTTNRNLFIRLWNGNQPLLWSDFDSGGVPAGHSLRIIVEGIFHNEWNSSIMN